MADIILQNTTKDAILGGILYFNSVRDAYLKATEGSSTPLLRDTDPVVRTPYAAIERSIKLYIQADPRVSPVIIMRFLIDHVTTLPSGYRGAYLSLLEMLDNRDNFSEQISQRFLQEVTQLIVVTTATDELKRMRTVQDTRAVLAELSAKLSAVEKPGKVRLFNPVADSEEVLVHRDKVPTGISWFDELTGGGIVWGEHGGTLGPSGGGKSVIANMLTCNLAIQGYNTMLLQFEQSVKYNSDISSRIYSYLTRLPTSEFVNKSSSELSQEARDALKKCSSVSDRIRFGSFIDDNVARNVDTIIETIDDSIKAGFAPKFVVIDWLGAVVQDFLGVDGNQQAKYQEAAQAIMDRLNAFAKTHGISLFYLHQLSTTAGKRESGYKPGMYESYYFTGFCHKVEYQFQLGTKSELPDGTFVAWLVAGKVRGARPGKAVVVRVNGAYARMDMTKDGEFYVDKKGALAPIEDQIRGGDDADEFPIAGTDSFVNGYS